MQPRRLRHLRSSLYGEAGGLGPASSERLTRMINADVS